jgi:hypothetical protein
MRGAKDFGSLSFSVSDDVLPSDDVVFKIKNTDFTKEAQDVLEKIKNSKPEQIKSKKPKKEMKNESKKSKK